MNLPVFMIGWWKTPVGVHWRKWRDDKSRPESSWKGNEEGV